MDGPKAESVRTYKFMTSVLVPPRMRGMFIKPMEKLTGDGNVPFVRLLISGVSMAMSLILIIMYASRNDVVWRYAGPAIIVLYISACTCMVIYLMSSRNSSMLPTVVRFDASRLHERVRSHNDLRLSTLGIRSVTKRGVIEFEDGDVGYAYKVRGRISASTLPGLATRIAEVRAGWYAVRGAGTQEMRITTVQANDMADQVDSMEAIRDAHALGHDPSDAWITAMADYQLQVYEQLMRSGHQLTMDQTVILRDSDPDSLMASSRNFENCARQGMYDVCERCRNAESVTARLSGVSMFVDTKTKAGESR